MFNIMLVLGVLQNDLTFAYISTICPTQSYYNIIDHIPGVVFYICITIYYISGGLYLLSSLKYFVLPPPSLLATNCSLYPWICFLLFFSLYFIYFCCKLYYFFPSNNFGFCLFFFFCSFRCKVSLFILDFLFVCVQR